MKEEDTFSALSRFQESRRALAEAVDALAALAAKRRDTGLSMRAWSLARGLDDGRFRVALVGGRKRGKSTLVNALVGARLMPAGVVPMTSLVTTVGYGEEARASVHLAGGESHEVGLDHLADYAARKEGAEGAHAISVEYPSPLLRHGVTLVDTPDAEPGEVAGAETYGHLAEGSDLVLGHELGDGGVAGVVQVSAKRALRARLGGEAGDGADGVSHLEKRIADVLGGERGGTPSSRRVSRGRREACRQAARGRRGGLRAARRRGGQRVGAPDRRTVRRRGDAPGRQRRTDRQWRRPGRCSAGCAALEAVREVVARSLQATRSQTPDGR